MAGDYPDILSPDSLEDAIAELARLGGAGAPLAGSTWIMRAPSRGERLRSTYVSLQRLGLDRIELGDPVLIGALASHADLAVLDDDAGPLGALSEAARASANRAIRNVATLGGNVCAEAFPASDLLPALLACEATVTVASSAGTSSLELAEYLATRRSRPTDEIVTQFALPAPPARHSWYERFTVRGGSEYPIAGVAVSVDVEDGIVAAARVAVGGVEELPSRVASAESALAGGPLSPEQGLVAGEEAAATLDGRNAPDAPGWYRTEILPALCQAAVERLAKEVVV